MNEYVREYAKIENRARRRGSFLLTYAPWIALLAALSIFGRVWSQTNAVRLVEEVARLSSEERELLLAQEEHKRTLVRLSSRERIASFARERLKMDYPGEEEVAFLPVAAPTETVEPPGPIRVERPEKSLMTFLERRLRGAVDQQAYARSSM